MGKRNCILAIYTRLLRESAYYVSGGIENASSFICFSDDKMLCNEIDHPFLCYNGARLDWLKSDVGIKEKLLY